MDSITPDSGEVINPTFLKDLSEMADSTAFRPSFSSFSFSSHDGLASFQPSASGSRTFGSSSSASFAVEASSSGRQSSGCSNPPEVTNESDSIISELYQKLNWSNSTCTYPVQRARNYCYYRCTRATPHVDLRFLLSSVVEAVQMGQPTTVLLAQIRSLGSCPSHRQLVRSVRGNQDSDSAILWPASYDVSDVLHAMTIRKSVMDVLRTRPNARVVQPWRYWSPARNVRQMVPVEDLGAGAVSNLEEWLHPEGGSPAMCAMADEPNTRKRALPDSDGEQSIKKNKYHHNHVELVVDDTNAMDGAAAAPSAGGFQPQNFRNAWPWNLGTDKPEDVPDFNALINNNGPPSNSSYSSSMSNNSAKFVSDNTSIEDLEACPNCKMWWDLCVCAELGILNKASGTANVEQEVAGDQAFVPVSDASGAASNSLYASSMSNDSAKRFFDNTSIEDPEVCSDCKVNGWNWCVCAEIQALKEVLRTANVEQEVAEDQEFLQNCAGSRESSPELQEGV